MKPAEKLKRITEHLDQLDSTLTTEEFVQAFSVVLDILEKEQKGSAEEWKSIRGDIESLKQALRSDNTVTVGKLETRIARALRELDNGMNFMRDKVRSLKNGKDGKSIKGDKGDKGDPGRDGTALSAEEIRDRLELLEGEERIDASAIKNLPENITKVIGSTGIHGPLWSLQDVDVTGLVAGQSIKWDGTRWIPYTPAGGTTTAVYGEAPTDTGDHLSFTLAHTPSTGTLRVYRGGAYQQSAVDYTLSGDTITLSVALQSGEVLLTDYEW
jgi:hypothetical protein